MEDLSIEFIAVPLGIAVLNVSENITLDISFDLHKYDNSFSVDIRSIKVSGDGNFDWGMVKRVESEIHGHILKSK